MDLAQGRSIKLVRPTDDSDVCEGNGIDFGHERFEKVRSAVRESVLWSIVILSSHGAGIIGKSLGPTIAALREVIRTDKNVICVGYALDALGRLANLRPEGEEPSPPIHQLQSDYLDILKETPVRGWEALVRGGVNPDLLAEFPRKG
jgi:hypothetical protein